MIRLLRFGWAVLLGLVVLGGLIEAPAYAAPDGPAAVTLTLFWGDGCPKCEAERAFLDDLRTELPGLHVEQFEVWKHEANRARFAETAKRMGFDASAVPTTIVSGRVWIGFTDAIRDDIRRTVQRALAGAPVPSGVYGQAGAGTCDEGAQVCEVPARPAAEVEVPLIGAIDLGDRSLVLSTLVIGFVDGINPCSLWVISILLAIVIRTGSRRRVLAVGSAFLLVTAGMYAVYMGGIYSALSVIGYLGAIRAGIAVVAGILGILSIKDYFWFGRGVSASIPQRSKPGIYQRVRGVAASRALLPALAATVALAIGVSLLETPCTAGVPVLWTGMLAAADVGLGTAAALFVLYMIPFLIDELAVFAVAVLTMRAAKLQDKHGRMLKLVAGVVMLALAGVMLAAPQVMEDVLGATLVFAGALAAAVVVHLATTRRTAGTDR